MSDETFLSQFINYTNADVFLREFSFSKTNFKPAGKSEIELVDHFVRVGSMLFIYQLKEKGPTDSFFADWVNKRIKIAKDQIKSTIKYLSKPESIWLQNERGIKFDVSLRNGDELFSLILFKYEDKPATEPYPQFYISKVAGFIHIFDATDYFDMCRYMITPTEIAEYLRWREEVFRKNPELPHLREEALVGQFLIDDLDSVPNKKYSRSLDALIDETESFDMKHIFENFRDRIVFSVGGNTEETYYPILTLMALLTRRELANLRERILVCKKSVDTNEIIRPTRFYCPKLDCGFVITPIMPEFHAHSLDMLNNIALMAKYDQKVTHQIGVSIEKWKGAYDINWFYTSSPWVRDAHVEEALKNAQFNPVERKSLARYNFNTQELRNFGLLKNEE